jgi:hypothetical protein
MTLNARNKVFFVFSLFSAAVIILSGLLVLVRFITASGFSFPKTVAAAKLSENFFIFRSYPAALVFSMIYLALYVPVTGFAVSINFQKTQSAEIIYFGGFLLGCLTETARIYIVFFELWNTYFDSYFILARIIFFGRMITSLCFLFSAILAVDQKPQETDKNFIIITAASAVFAVLIPINPITTNTLGMPVYGFAHIFRFIRILFFVITCATYFFTGIWKKIPEYRKAALWYLFLFAGYTLLLAGDSPASAVAGSLLLTVGTVRFLETIHQYYLWI